MEYNALELIWEGRSDPQDLRLSLLESITDKFSDERIIGEGGFATVYKGILRNGEVAVKRIRNYLTIDEKLFRREVNSLMNANHQNIVRFLGFCSNTMHKVIKPEGREEYIYAEIRERILCFEYINNGSLDKYITDELRGLEWYARYEIIKGICEGLKYLHVVKHVIHMDLKPANILLDNHMVAKIADFGLSRMDENTQTKSEDRFSSLGYCAPEYLNGGKMSVKSDVYSLGIIIIELVTGHKGIPDTNNVLRRWRHRWQNLGKKTPFVYQQIAKLIEIGIHCQEKDPCKRPYISKVVGDVNELGNMDMQISVANESMVGQISPYLEDDMLGIKPLDLHFPFKQNKQIPCTLELTNETKACIAFDIQTTSPLPYCTQPSQGIVQPQSKRRVNITLQPLDNAPQDKPYTRGFIVRSTKVNEGLTNEDINDDIFNEVEGKLVDEVALTVAYGDQGPKVVHSLEVLTILGKGNMISPEESNVPPTEKESTTTLCASNELIQFDRPQLWVPFLPNKMVTMLCFFKIINVTDHYVGFKTWVKKINKASHYLEPNVGILRPRSTQTIKFKSIAKEDEQEYMNHTEIIGAWNGIVAEGVEVSDFSKSMFRGESKELSIVFTTTSLCTSNELIKFDPPRPHFPFSPNKRLTLMGVFRIINVTDHCVGFNTWARNNNKAVHYLDPSEGILQPWSTQVIKVRSISKEKEPKDMQCIETIGVWNGMVAEGVKVGDFSGNVFEEQSKELPIVFGTVR